MTTSARVLIIDDDRDFVTVYREMFERQGLEVMVAHTAEDAIRLLEALGRQLDVILLDQKLQGRGGPDSGLDLIGRIGSLTPLAKTIVVTGYASPDAIERAFQLGVYDYLVKNGAFDALLRAKVRNAIEVTGERRLAALSKEQVISELRTTWELVRRETNPHRKGRLLEELVRLLFRSIPGFEVVYTRLHNRVEEIDIVVENRSEDPFWKNEHSQYILGECKNWSSTCGSPEFRDFYDKLKTKNERARLGFFFAVGGFTSAFFEARARHSEGDALIVPVDAQGLDGLINADDRLRALTDLHRDAVFDRSR